MLCQQNTNSKGEIQEEVWSFLCGADIGSSQLSLSDSVTNENVNV